MQHVIFLHNKEAAFCGDTAARVCVWVCVCAQYNDKSLFGITEELL